MFSLSAEEKIRLVIFNSFNGFFGHHKINTPDELKREHNFIDDFGADSLDIAEMLLDVEDAFDCTIIEEDAEKIETIGDLFDYANEHNLM